jgi:nitroimidazol reductase NimA-like FMN-containing flavoprotein (pyridoxamine 5'-phosphate oxidase superfamily)
MTADEIDEVLAEGTKAQVATLNPDGSVHLVPMSYVVVDGRLTLWTDPASRKVSNLRNEPRITCLVELGDDFASFRAVQLVGTARVSSDPDESRAVGEALFARSVGELSDDLLAYVAGLVPQRVAVSVEPLRIVSWDHRKLAGARPDQVGA